MTKEEFLANLNSAIINPLLLLLIAAATVYFLWGLFTFVMNAEDSAERAEGKRKIVWGLIGLFIMLSVFGIIRIALATFGIANPAGL